MMIPACWSRMFVRFWNLRNGGLMRASTTNTIRNGMRIPARLTIRPIRIVGLTPGAGAAVAAPPDGPAGSAAGSTEGPRPLMPHSRCGPECGSHNGLLGHRLASELGDESAATHHEHAV